MDIDGIRAAADEWKQKAEAAEAQGRADIDRLQFDYALAAALSGAKARDSKAVTALLDMGGLKLNNGEIVVLNEQLAKLKTDKDFLFESDEPAPRVVRGTGQTPKIDDDAAVRSIMGLPPKTD